MVSQLPVKTNSSMMTALIHLYRAFFIGHSLTYQSEGKRRTPYLVSLLGILTENVRIPRTEGRELH